MNYSKRVKRLLDELKKRGLDSFFVTEEANVRYLSGFSGHDSFLLITPERRYLLTDSRYVEDASDTAKGFKITAVAGSVYPALEAIAGKEGLRDIGFESTSIPYESAIRLKGIVSKRRLTGVRDLIENLRSVKDDAELRLIRKSVAITRKVLEKSVKGLKPESTEQAVADRIEIEFINNNARPSFELIVASGPNSSKPHARPSGRRIGKNGFVMIDIGCTVGGYNSDITRMAAIGRLSARFKRIYHVVREAQERAIAGIRAGARISEIDFAARSFIHKNGFGKYFAHALGHGVGLSVHEQPSISRSSEGTLKPGMVFTVEPAIYIPGFGGVRIEDMVLVKDKGCEILTQ